jgi:hypothetical protein
MSSHFSSITTEISVPIPSEPPSLEAAAQLSNPTHSVALESLIQQNIELTTRLNIQLRRVSELEQGLSHYQTQMSQFQNQKESFKEEIQVLHRRFQTQENLVITYRIDKENAEKAYANLVMDHKSLKERIEGDRNRFVARIQRLEKYRRRIRESILPLFRQYKAGSELVIPLKNRVQSLERYKSKIKKHVRPWVRGLKLDLQAQSQKVIKQEIKSQELALRIQELINHLKVKSQSFEQDQKTLVEYHEKRFSTVSKELELYKLDFENQKHKLELTLRSKNHYEEANAALENQAILAGRKLAEVTGQNQTEILKLQQDLKAAEELWTESNKKAEMLEAHLAASQRLNEKMGQDMREARNENELLRLRIRQAKTQTSGTEALFQTTPMPQTIIEDVPNESAGRIEGLMAEIQSGHSKRIHQPHVALGSSPLPDREDFGDLL